MFYKISQAGWVYKARSPEKKEQETGDFPNENGVVLQTS